MSDIEERLRTALGTLADEVEPAEDPRAELARRLESRRRPGRVPAVAAAVTVAVAFGAALAFLPASDGSGPPGATTTGRPEPTRELIADLGTVVRGGETLRAFAVLQGGNYCTAVMARGDRTGDFTCEQVPNWPGGQTGSHVQSREVLNGDPADDTGMLANRLVFLADPEVATLTVRRGDGTQVRVSELDRNEHATLFLADFAGPPDGFGYTARAADGKVIEEAIT